MTSFSEPPAWPKSRCPARHDRHLPNTVPQVSAIPPGEAGRGGDGHGPLRRHVQPAQHPGTVHHSGHGRQCEAQHQLCGHR